MQNRNFLNKYYYHERESDLNNRALLNWRYFAVLGDIYMAECIIAGRTESLFIHRTETKFIDITDSTRMGVTSFYIKL